MEWERIDDYTERSKVFEGWLVKAHADVYHNFNDDRGMACGWDFRVTMCFVPDENHEWELQTQS